MIVARNQVVQAVLRLTSRAEHEVLCRIAIRHLADARCLEAGGKAEQKLNRLDHDLFSLRLGSYRPSLPG
jgi:hypothetical protein